jgi:hypothetical protein
MVDWDLCWSKDIKIIHRCNKFHNPVPIISLRCKLQMCDECCDAVLTQGTSYRNAIVPIVNDVILIDLEEIYRRKLNPKEHERSYIYPTVPIPIIERVECRIERFSDAIM